MVGEISKRSKTARVTTISSTLASTFPSCDNSPNVVLIDKCERFVFGEQTCYCVIVCAISTNSRTGSINSVVHGLKWCCIFAGDNIKNIFLNEKIWFWRVFLTIHYSDNDFLLSSELVNNLSYIPTYTISLYLFIFQFTLRFLVKR